MANSVLRNAYAKYKDFVADNVELIGEVESALKWMSYFVAEVLILKFPKKNVSVLLLGTFWGFWSERLGGRSRIFSIPAGRHFSQQEVLESYYFLGRGKDISPIISELMYSASNILVLVNDTIIKQAMKTATDLSVPEQYFKFALTLIEYLEVFAEVSSQKVWGSRGKWLVIAIIQLLKMALRLILLLKEKSGFLFSPPIMPLTAQQRRTAHQHLRQADATQTNQTDNTEKSATSKVQMTFTLKRSGRTVRTVSSSPPVLGRTWKVPVEPKASGSSIIPWGLRDAPSLLDHNRSLAEIIHVIRPLVHLEHIPGKENTMADALSRMLLPETTASMECATAGKVPLKTGCDHAPSQFPYLSRFTGPVFAMHSFGSQSWKPWLLACGMDVASLRLVGKHQDLNSAERGELRFRTIAILYYLLRSPFYDKFTKERLIKALSTIAKTVPGGKFLCNPLIDYLPSWQQTYFYNWGC